MRSKIKNSLMSNYSNEIKIKHILSKIEMCEHF